MKTRVLTGMILGLVMISGILYSFITCQILFAIILGFSHIEWKKHFVPNTPKFAKIILEILFLITFWLLLKVNLYSSHDYVTNVFPFFNLITVLILCLIGLLLYLKREWLIAQTWIIALFYIYLPVLIGIYFLNQNFEVNRWLILGLVIINWCNDSFAYFTGRLVGKTPLAFEISPKKTIEGALGGIIFGILAALILNHYMFVTTYSIGKIILLGVAVCLAGITGDLYESKMKRLAGIKDSGALLPGHGGFLDRFDSFFYIIPVGIYILTF